MQSKACAMRLGVEVAPTPAAAVALDIMTSSDQHRRREGRALDVAVAAPTWAWPVAMLNRVGSAAARAPEGKPIAGRVLQSLR